MIDDWWLMMIIVYDWFVDCLQYDVFIVWCFAWFLLLLNWRLTRRRGGGGYCVLTVLLYLLYFFIFLAYIYNIFAFGGYHFVNKLLVQKLRPVFRSFRWLNFLRYVTFRYIFSSFFSSRERKREIKFKLNKYNKTVQNNVHT
jgi:hypothetical protein